MTERGHIPVLLREVVATLAPRPGETFVDATAGLGGHAAAVAPSLAPGGRVILNDADPANLERAAANVRAAAPGVDVITLRGNFAELPHRLRSAGLRADALLADLGFASTQIDDAARGLSFSKDGPLDMRLDPAGPTTAADLVASLSESDLADIISRFGEDRHARRIAARIAEARVQAPITTTARLAEVVRAAAGPSGGIDPATRTFQALRIAVNDELGCLDALLAGVQAEAASIARGVPGTWLNPGCRVVVIAFHSLEDRAVKAACREIVRSGGTDLTRGPVEAGDGERESNPRARSAKMRAVALPARK